VVCEDFAEAVAIAREQAEDDGAREVCVIGGASLFEAALPKAKRLYLTEVDAEVEGDVVLPPIDESRWREVRSERHEAGPTTTTPSRCAYSSGPDAASSLARVKRHAKVPADKPLGGAHGSRTRLRGAGIPRRPDRHERRLGDPDRDQGPAPDPGEA
jgi:hypothetical protein